MRILCLAFLFFLLSIQLIAQDENIFIAIVGGTSFGDPAAFGKGILQQEGAFTIDTKAGKSPTIYQMRYKDVPFYYIRMYGAESALPGEREGLHHIRTWLALHELGVTHALGGASSGAIRTDYDYDDLVIVDDFMEMEVNRPQNILKYAEMERPGVFANYAQPFSPSLRTMLIKEAMERQQGYSGALHTTGTFVQHNPERFETAAEIRAIRILGGDLTSLNIATCAVYARQLGIRFAALCSIANPAVGVRPFTFKDMQESVQRIAAQAVPIVLEVVAGIPSNEKAMAAEPISTGEAYKGSYTNPDSESHNIVEPR